MANEMDISPEQSTEHIDLSIKTNRTLSSFQIFVVLSGLLFFCALCFQNYKLGQEVAVLNVKLDLQAKEIKKIKTDVSDIEWETNQIKSTVDSIDMKIEY